MGWIVLAIIMMICGAVGYAIGEPKGRQDQGFWLGLLGIVGWIVIALLPPTDEVSAKRAAIASGRSDGLQESSDATRECPWCAEVVKVRARICRYCDRDIQPLATPAGHHEH